MGKQASRRAAARATPRTGSSPAQLLKAGQRRPSAFRPYLDLGHKEAHAMASMLIEAPGVVNPHYGGMKRSAHTKENVLDGVKVWTKGAIDREAPA